MTTEPVKTPLEMFYHWEQTTPDWTYLRQAKDGDWVEYTWSDVGDRVRRLATFLRKQGFEPGSRIALFASNCADWFVVDLAIMLCGYVSVPLYPGQDPKSGAYILEHSGAKMLFLGGVDCAPQIADGSFAIDIPTVAILGCKNECDYQLEDIIANNDPHTESPTVDPDDLMTIIYTSGTTGNPKGVMHLHRTPGHVVPEMINTFTMASREGEDDRERYFSFLPLSHAAERIVVEMGSFYSNPTVSFSAGLETFATEMQSVQPTLFFAVPRLWTKFKAAIDAKVPPEAQAGFGDEEKAFVRQMLGLDKAKFIITGSAPTPRDIQQWFIDMGIYLRDGYGMTENFIDGCCWGYPGAPTPGCVGQPMGGAEFKLTDAGEICFRSKGLMKGYYKNPEKTAEVLIDGWYHTGDSGRIDEDGNLWVTGRISEVFKTTKGKFVKPTAIENHFGAIEELGQLMVFGHGFDQPMLLCNLSEIGQTKDRETLTGILQAGLEKINGELAAYEKVGAIIVTKDEWQIENALLTPTMKLKRKAIEDHYADLIASAKDAAPGSIVFE